MMRWSLVLVLAASTLAQSPPASPADLQRAAAEKQRAAAALQREAVRKQAAAFGVSLPPSVEAADRTAVERPPCDPMADNAVAPIIENAAKAQKIDPKLMRALIGQESGFHACAVSPKGAQGLMQLMPEIVKQFSVRDPFDPRENIEAGAKYLRQLLDRYKGDFAQALGAYNAGPGAVDQAGGIPSFPETRDYVDSILCAAGK